MNWYKTSRSLLIEELPEHIYQAISLSINGDWILLKHQKLRPPYKMQAYGMIEIDGRNVKATGDYFYIKIQYTVRKISGEIIHPYDGTYDPQGNIIHSSPLTPEEVSRRFRVLKEMDKEHISEYSSDIGNRLLNIRGFVEGSRPNQESEIGAFGEKEKIGYFEDLDTPYEVVQKIQEIIDRFYNDWGNENNEPKVEPDPTPSTRVPVGAYV